MTNREGSNNQESKEQLEVVIKAVIHVYLSNHLSSQHGVLR